MNNHTVYYKEDILKWLNQIRKSAKFSVNDTSFDTLKNWEFVNGKIQHLSHRFFNIVGVKFRYPNGFIDYRPLIEQREIGTLGFIWRNQTVPELLVQAKLEPGNVGIVQLAPTCQATASNSDRVHGGNIPPFSDVFDKGDIEFISDTLQSEQGSRFLGKVNRNVTASLKSENYELSPIHRWIPTDQVLNLLKTDYLFNTDARSVLVCSNWERLVGRKAFTKEKSVFARELETSYKDNGSIYTISKLKDRINKLRKQDKEPEIIPIDKIPNYKFTSKGLFPLAHQPISIKYIDVKTNYREVGHWQQPIIQSTGEGKVTLLCARKNNVLYFLFKAIIEPGLKNKVELSPSIIFEPGQQWSRALNEDEGKIIVETWQSDEGGRFFQDKSLYRIVDTGEIGEIDDEDIWLSIKQIYEMLQEGGWFTNEARSALSLLLPWL